MWINAHMKLHAEIETGGYRESGIGRLHGVEGLDEFLQTKHISWQTGVARSRRAVAADAGTGGRRSGAAGFRCRLATAATAAGSRSVAGVTGVTGNRGRVGGRCGQGSGVGADPLLQRGTQPRVDEFDAGTVR